MSPTGHDHGSHDHAGDGKKWSQDVTEHSDAMDLEEHIFESDDPTGSRSASSIRPSSRTGGSPSPTSRQCRC